MWTWKHHALALALAGASAGAQALDLIDVWQAAREHDAAYASARASWEAGQEKTIQGRAPLLPQLNASGDYTRNKAERPAGIGRYRSASAGLQLTQTLFDWSRFAALEQGRQATLIADDQFKNAEQELILRTAQAYFDVLLAEDTLEFTRAAKDAYAKQLEQAKKSFDVGSATITDTYEAQASYDSAVASELAALNDLEVKRNKLALQTGVSANRLDPLKAKVPLELPSPDSADSWVRQAEDGSYALAIRRKQLIVAGKQVDISRSGHLPTVSLVAGYNDRTSTQLASVDTRGGSVGVQITLPIFSGGLAQSKVREARALEEQARQDLEDARRQVEQATRTAYLGVTSGAAQVTAREQVLASSKSQLDATRLGREVGVRTSVDLLNAERKVYESRRDLAQARYQYLMARLQLAAAVGQLDRKVLEGVNQLLQARQSTALASAQPKPNKK